MTPDQVQKMIDAAIKANAQQQQYGPAVVPFHTHNGIDSATIKSPITSYMGQVAINGGAGPIFPKGWTCKETGFGQYTITHNLGYQDKNYTVFASSVDTIANYIIVNATSGNTYQNEFIIQWAQLYNPFVALTGSLSSGATSATLSSTWPGPTGSYLVNFSNGDIRLVTLTNGATTATWTPGISSAATNSFAASLLANVSFMFTLIVGSTSTNVA